MAEGNGELVDDVGVKSDDRADGERTEDYPKLIEYGLDKRVSICSDLEISSDHNLVIFLFLPPFFPCPH